MSTSTRVYYVASVVGDTTYRSVIEWQADPLCIYKTIANLRGERYRHLHEVTQLTLSHIADKYLNCNVFHIYRIKINVTLFVCFVPTDT